MYINHPYACTCMFKHDALRTVKPTTVRQAIHSAMKALQEDCLDCLQEYLALNDFILEQIQHACTCAQEDASLAATSESDSLWNKLTKVYYMHA